MPKSRPIWLSSCQKRNEPSVPKPLQFNSYQIDKHHFCASLLHLVTIISSSSSSGSDYRQKHPINQMEPTQESQLAYEMIPQPSAQLNGDSASLASLDGLIDDLASTEDESEPHDSRGVNTKHGSGPQAPSDEFLSTDLSVGLQEAEVEARRRKFGMNELHEEKKNHFLTFLMFFVGPIQFVMEVSPCLAFLDLRQHFLCQRFRSLYCLFRSSST